MIGPIYAMGNWTIFAFLIVSVLLTLYAWKTFGSRSDYREDAIGDINVEVLQAEGKVLDGEAGMEEVAEVMKSRKETV